MYIFHLPYSIFHLPQSSLSFYPCHMVSSLHFCHNRNIFVVCFLFWADAGVGEPGRTVNPLADAFGGSNPSPPTLKNFYDGFLKGINIFYLIFIPLFFCSFFIDSRIDTVRIFILNYNLNFSVLFELMD